MKIKKEDISTLQKSGHFYLVLTREKVEFKPSGLKFAVVKPEGFN